MFGEAAAEKEASKYPELLKTGFVEREGAATELLAGDRFLVLGSKGTGKSALAQHLDLTKDNNTFVHVTTLRKFRYRDVAGIVGGESDHLPEAWSWLLLANMFASFAKAAGNIHTDPELTRLHDLLTATDLVPAPGGIKALLDASHADRLTRDLPRAYEGTYTVSRNAERTGKSVHKRQSFRFPVFVRDMLSILTRFKSDSRHFLILDDTDEVLHEGRHALYSLSALIQEASDINSAFQEAGVKAKVIVLCRTDLFEELPGSNTNKTRRGEAIELNWYTPDNDASPLWTVANQRAAMQCGVEIDIVAKYFPEIISRGDERIRILPKDPTRTKEYLLRHTRYTPRDFVTLLRCIQNRSRHDTVTAEEIAYGLKEYANAYFVPEIKNELDGYFANPADVSAIMDAFGEIRDARFEFDNLRTRLPVRTREQLPAILKHLFNSNCIGNWETDGEASHRTYRYKEPHTRLDMARLMILHPALGLAFNVRGEDEAERLLDDTRENSPLLRGDVIFVNREEGYGFIETSEGRRFHFTLREVIGYPRVRLAAGDHVAFDSPADDMSNRKAPHVKTVCLVERSRSARV